MACSHSSRPPAPLIAHSAAMKQVLAIARKAACVLAPVLIGGESGVGKRELARFIHAHGPRRDATFAELHCATLDAPALEAELFGPQAGLPPPRVASCGGLLQQARGGTLFLNELDELALEAQPKLLGALDADRRPCSQAWHRLAPARVIASASLPLEQVRNERRLRADLYHRLNVFQLEIPPLRERPEDIGPLATELLRHSSHRAGRPVLQLADCALHWLTRQPWPGNELELASTIERTVLLCDIDREQLQAEDFASPLAQ